MWLEVQSSYFVEPEPSSMTCSSEALTKVERVRVIDERSTVISLCSNSSDDTGFAADAISFSTKSLIGDGLTA